MDGLFGLLLIAAMIAFGVVRQLKKDAAAEEARKANPNPTDGEGPDGVPEVILMPEPWHKMSIPVEVLRPEASGDVPEHVRRRRENRAKRETAAHAGQRPEVSRRTTVSRPDTYAEPSNAQSVSPAADEDFAIRSAEDARRAIIWGEILQRKY